MLQQHIQPVTIGPGEELDLLPGDGQVICRLPAVQERLGLTYGLDILGTKQILQ